MTQYKPNYNEAKYNREFYTNKSNQTESYLPEQVNLSNGQQQYDPIYNSNDDVNSKDFLIGALVGGIIGAATALFLAPKSGAELRGDVSTQATHLKDKTVDLSSTAKEKTSQLSSQLKEKSGPLVDKVKSIKSKTATPMDDGTVSSEGEEPIEFMETVTNTIDEVAKEETNNTTSTAEALKEAVADKKTL